MQNKGSLRTLSLSFKTFKPPLLFAYVPSIIPDIFWCQKYAFKITLYNDLLIYLCFNIKDDPILRIHFIRSYFQHGKYVLSHNTS